MRAKRKKIFIYREFRRTFLWGYGVNMLTALLAVCAVMAVAVKIMPPQGPDLVVMLLLGLSLAALLSLLLSMYWMVVLASRRIGGPLLRFERSLDQIAQGDLTGEINLRQKDQLKGIAGQINQMTSSLHQRVGSLHSQARQLRLLADSGADQENLRPEIEKLCHSVDELFNL